MSKISDFMKKILPGNYQVTFTVKQLEEYKKEIEEELLKNISSGDCWNAYMNFKIQKNTFADADKFWNWIKFIGEKLKKNK